MTMRPYNSPDPVEKTFVAMGAIGAALLAMALAYSFFFLQ